MRRLVAVLACAAVVVPLSGCGLFGSEPSPNDAANQFIAALAGGDATTAANATDASESAKSLIESVRRALKPESVSGTVRSVDPAPDGARSTHAEYELRWDLGRGRTWSYTGKLELRSGDDRWLVHWAPSVLHPDLAAQQSLALRTDAPELAPVLDRDGQVLLAPERVISVLLDGGKAGDLPAVAGSLATALTGFDAGLDARAITDGATKAGNAAYLVMSLREADYQQVKPQIYELPGVRFSEETRLLPADKAFASQVLPAVRTLVEDEVAGTAGWRVVTVDGSGAEVRELFAHAAEPSTAITATLSRAVQTAAEGAIDGETAPAMLVALQPSTGEVLAVAQNAAADAQGSLALTGRYPPGSTFKIITAAAAMESGTFAADTPVGCPGSTTINGRAIPNSHNFDKGTIPLHQALAFSCNTSFARLAADLPDDALTDAAKRLGLGADFVIPGFTTITGSVPPASNIVERAEDGFGQGKVVASPFGMAVVVSAVASGSTPTPTLLRGQRTESDTESRPFAAPVLTALREMMREVVTVGTAGLLAQRGDVRGKTGTAQFGDGTQSHAWFAGYRGDLAFAVLVVGGGESITAVHATDRFLAAVG